MISIPLKDIDIPTTYPEWSKWWDNIFEQMVNKSPSSDEINLTFQKPSTPEEQAATDISIKAAIEAGKAHNLKVIVKYED